MDLRIKDRPPGGGVVRCGLELKDRLGLLHQLKLMRSMKDGLLILSEYIHAMVKYGVIIIFHFLDSFLIN